MREKTRHRGARRLAVLALLALAVSFASSASAEIPPDAANHPLLQPIDAQNWVDQGELTWAAYKPVPDAHPEFYDGSADGTQSQYKTAIILIDYPDQPFLITQPPGTHPFGNPQPGWTPVAPEDVNQWMHDYYAVPNEYNGGKTLSGYWMEDSHGKIGIDVEVFGPYTMAAKSFEYGLRTDFNSPVGNQANSVCPAGYTCNRNIRTDGGNALARRDRLRLGPVRLRQRLLRDGRPRRVVDLAGVRRDALDRPRPGAGQVRASRGRGRPGPERRRQSDPELGPDPLRALDVMARCGEPLAECGRRHLDAGGELRPERLRARVQPPARAAGQLQQPVRRHRPELHRLLGDDEPRDLQRPGRHPQPLADPQPGRFGARAAPPAPLQEPARRAHPGRPGHGRAEHAAGAGGRGRRHQGARVRTGRRHDGAHGQLRRRRRSRRHVCEPGLRRRPALLLPEPQRELPALPGRGRRSGRERLVRARSRRADHEEPEQRYAAGLDDRPEPGGHRDDRLLPARRDARRGRSRRPTPVERRNLPGGDALRQRVRVRGHVQQAPLLRARHASRRRRRPSLRRRRAAGRRGRSVHAGYRAGCSDEDASARGLPRHLHLPADEHGPGGCSPV